MTDVKHVTPDAPRTLSDKPSNEAFFGFGSTKLVAKDHDALTREEARHLLGVSVRLSKSAPTCTTCANIYAKVKRITGEE